MLKKIHTSICVVFVTLGIIFTAFTGCAAQEDPSYSENAKENILAAVSSLTEANSIEYTSTESMELTLTDKTQRSTLSEAEYKMIRAPYTVFTHISLQGGAEEESKHTIEFFYEVKNGKFNTYIRDAIIPVDAKQEDTGLGEWRLSSETDEAQARLLIDNVAATMAARQYLIESNIDSFTYVESVKTENATEVKYSGTLAHETILDAYRIYLRDIFVQADSVPESLPGNENPSYTLLEDEIINRALGGQYELMQGITGLTFSKNPISLSIWIDVKSMSVKKVEVDKREAEQAIIDMEAPGTVIKNALTVYDISGIDSLTAIEMPI